MISDDRCAQALKFLAETDVQAAELKTDVARKEYAAELARKRVFLVADGNNEERKATAEVSPDVQAAEGVLADAILAHEKMAARRKTEAMVVDVWRSVNANRRTGNI